MARIKVDGGSATFLPLCECGWRGLPAASHGGALLQARHHEVRAHPGELHAAKALDNHRRRHG